MFDKNFKITCDYCHKTELDTGEKDVSSCNELAVIAGWHVEKLAFGKRKTIHICNKCCDEEKK